MSRSSRHKSHRAHKHRDRSDSEDESARVSRALDQERKSALKDLIGVSNGDTLGDHGKKRKDRVEDLRVGSDRWNGGGDDEARVEKESKKKEYDAEDMEKCSKVKSLSVDLKGKSSSGRRREGSSERNERKGKGRENEKERELEKYKKFDDSRNRRFDNGQSRREDRAIKQGVEISELQDNLDNPDLENEHDKRIKRRKDGSGDRNKVDDGRKREERHVSSRDDHPKYGNSSYKDAGYKEKYREEHDGDQRYHDDKCREEHSLRTHICGRSDSKHYRDECRLSRSRDKKPRLQCSDRDSSRHGDDHSPKLEDNRGMKKSCNETEDQNDIRPRSAKIPCEDTSKNGSSSSKFDPHSDRGRLEHPHDDKVDSSLSSIRKKNSPNTSTFAVKDLYRRNSKQAEFTHSESLSEDARCSSTVSRDHPYASGGRERISECLSSLKAKSKVNIPSDFQSSPTQLSEKSPFTSDCQPERIAARRNLEKVGQRTSSLKGGKGDVSFSNDNGSAGDTSQLDPLKREVVAVALSSNQTSQLQCRAPGHLPPPPPVRFGVDSTSLPSSYEHETSNHNGDRKTNPQYKRGGDANAGRGQGTPWKSAPTTWSSPVANGFMPLQHGPPSGFHPGLKQFPAPPLFGVRPSMDLNNTRYSAHEAGNRFPGHAHPFGWHNPVDCSPPSQMWNGNPNLFGDKCDQSHHLMNSRGWETSTDIWIGQNGNVEIPLSHKEYEYPQQVPADEGGTCKSRNEHAWIEQPLGYSSGIKLSSDTFPAKQAMGTSLKVSTEKLPDFSKKTNVKGTSEPQIDNKVHYYCTYFSKLDISLDLVRPELYKQCMSLMEAIGRNVSSNVFKQGHLKKNVESPRLVGKSKFAHNSLFPPPTNATYQRAMSLYKKQKEGMTRFASSLVCSDETQNNTPKLAYHIKEGPLLANSASDDYMEEGVSAAANVNGEHWDDPINTNAHLVVNCSNKVDNSSDAKENFGESEAIIPVCGLNVSRIHLSENTC